jgi:formylglycine-generating enzyme required for sulfatase activity
MRFTLAALAITCFLVVLVTPLFAQRSTTCLQIKCNPGYEICLDGRISGYSDEAQQGFFFLDIEPGEHRIKVSAKGKLPEIRYVMVPSGAVVVEEISLLEFTNKVTIQTVPLECELHSSLPQLTFLKTSDGITLKGLPIGEHTVEVKGLGKKLSFKLPVNDDSDIDLMVNMLTEEIIVNERGGAWLPPGDWEIIDKTPGENGLPRKIMDHLTGITFILVDAGDFLMGERALKGSDTFPAHKVVLDSFYLGETEVTELQWSMSIGELQLGVTGGLVLKARGGDDFAMPGISYDDCMLLLAELGPGYRLPTEAEWEYACRAGTTGGHFYDYEKHSLGEFAWFEQNANHMIHRVAQKLPNPWGFYDMYGNVWEWCSDNYKSDYYAKSPRENPKGPKVGHRGQTVLRGGAWFSPKTVIRSAFREHMASSVRGRSYAGGIILGNYGFRMAYEIPN